MEILSQSCGDVLTKKKLDPHRGQCRGASFTCLDCMTHFPGSSYRAHTSCVSEAQKYQGHLYKEKASKPRKSVTIAEARSLAPPKAYVEDAPDADLDNYHVAIVNAPPHAPSPPPIAPAGPVNVFDFLLPSDTPNASRVSLGGSNEQMCMVEHAQPLFKSRTSSPHDNTIDAHDNHFHSNGYAYGAEPIAANEQDSYRTPAPKIRTIEPRDSTHDLDDRDRRSTDKKRKRQIEDLDLTQTRRSSQESDQVMADADAPTSAAAPAILHSGLTGGLNRLLSKSRFPPSPDHSGGDGKADGHPSPAPRKREATTTITSDKNRGRASTALIKVRKVRRTSDESRPRKHHRSHRPAHTTTHTTADDARADRPRRTVKTIEYPSHGSGEAADDSPYQQSQELQQMVVYRTRAELFLSFINKGPESESGCSINKALKRYHRERSERGLGLGKQEEEKELWKSLRVRRNERGEVVLIL